MGRRVEVGGAVCGVTPRRRRRPSCSWPPGSTSCRTTSVQPCGSGLRSGRLWTVAVSRATNAPTKSCSVSYAPPGTGCAPDFAFFLDELCQGPAAGIRESRLRGRTSGSRVGTRSPTRTRPREVCRRPRLFESLAPAWTKCASKGRAAFVLAGDLSFPERSRGLRLLPEYDASLMAFQERDQLVPPPVRELVAEHGRGRCGACRSALRARRDRCRLWERRKRGKRIEIEVWPARASVGHTAPSSSAKQTATFVPRPRAGAQR